MRKKTHVNTTLYSHTHTENHPKTILDYTLSSSAASGVDKKHSAGQARSHSQVMKTGRRVKEMVNAERKKNNFPVQ